MPFQKNLKPPLKWAGGKRWLLPRLLPLWLEYRDRRLVEPFCGGLAVTLGLQPHKALLGDNNPHLINFYHWLKKGMQISIPLINSADVYYSHRSRFNKLIYSGGEETKEAAELFYYLNRTGYNGLCRFNKKGEFNVPFGRYNKINYTYDFTSYQQQLSDYECRYSDFQLLEIGPQDFIYADPPYDVEFTRYSKVDFSWADQIRLAEWLALHKGPVVLSNQATPRVLELYQKLGFTNTCLPGPRRISCTGDRSPAIEVLASKNIRYR